VTRLVHSHPRTMRSRLRRAKYSPAMMRNKEIARTARQKTAPGADSTSRHDPVFAARPPNGVPPGIFGDRALEGGLVESASGNRHEHQFAVGRLPDQAIRQPLLSAGRMIRSGVGNIGRIEIRPSGRIDRGGSRLPAAASSASRCAALADSWRDP